MLADTLGHRKVVMTTPNLGGFWPEEARNPFFEPEKIKFKYCVTVTPNIAVEKQDLAEK